MRLKGTEQNILGGKLRRGVTTRMIDADPSDVYEIRPRRKGGGIDLIGDQLRQGPIWYAGPDAVRKAIAYAKYRSWSRSRRAIIRVLDDSGVVIEAH